MRTRTINGLATLDLDNALAVAEEHGKHLEVIDAKNCMQLCMLRFRASKPGAFVLNGNNPILGDIIQGPLALREDERNLKNLQRFMWGERIRYTPPVRGNGTDAPAYCITRAPKIDLYSLFETHCVMCGHGHKKIGQEQVLEHVLNLDGSAPADRWTPDMRVVCRCGVHPMHIWKFSNRAIGQKGKHDLPILVDEEIALLEPMLKAWQEGVPNAPTLQLPRVYCTYATGTQPDLSWRPSDEAQERIWEGALRMAHPMSVLPYEVAAPYHQAPEPISKALVGFVVEARPLAIGWVKQQDMDGTAGWTRVMRTQR